MQNIRLRVASNFGDSDCGAGKIHTRARNFEASHLLEIPRVRVYFAPPTIAITKIRDCAQSSKTYSRQVKAIISHTAIENILMISTNYS